MDSANAHVMPHRGMHVHLDISQIARRFGSSRFAAAVNRLLIFALVPAFVLTAASAQTLTVLYSFKGGTDGDLPQATLARDPNTGNLYGTTAYGGVPGCTYCGTVFEVTPGGSESILHVFTDTPDGATPTGRLLQIGSNLYGTTQYGGAYGPGFRGGGTVFQVSPGGVPTILFNFNSSDTYGARPAGGLIQDPRTGTLYGTTAISGSDDCGTVFTLSPAGVETVLLGFNGQDGCRPEGSLLQDAATGNLYGATFAGGSDACAPTCGIVFELSPTGAETVLHTFTPAKRSVSDGAWPTGDPGLARDAAGNLYGTTLGGGLFCPNDPSGGCGVVYEVTPDGAEKVIYRFKGVKKGDGAGPLGGLVLDEQGNLYGTTSVGGIIHSTCLGGRAQRVGCGTVFELSPPAKKKGRWTEKVLYEFIGNEDGAGPSAGLVRDPQTGDLYGVTGSGGDLSCVNSNVGCGVVFKLTP